MSTNLCCQGHVRYQETAGRQYRRVVAWLRSWGRSASPSLAAGRGMVGNRDRPQRACLLGSQRRDPGIQRPGPGTLTAVASNAQAAN